jgi:hypothetical protein
VFDIQPRSSSRIVRFWWELSNASLNDVLIYLTYESDLFMHFFIDINKINLESNNISPNYVMFIKIDKIK